MSVDHKKGRRQTTHRRGEMAHNATKRDTHRRCARAPLHGCREGVREHQRTKDAGVVLQRPPRKSTCSSAELGSVLERVQNRLLKKQLHRRIRTQTCSSECVFCAPPPLNESLRSVLFDGTAEQNAFANCIMDRSRRWICSVRTTALV